MTGWQCRPGAQPDSRLSATAAFSRADVLALVVVAVLVSLPLPAAVGQRGARDSILCLSNLRKLTQAWQSFAQEHNGDLPGNLDGGEAQIASNSNRTWCVGWLDYAARPDNTNTLFLANAQLGPYLPSRDVSVFKCPADQSTVRYSSGILPRVRSVSMNGWMGARSTPWLPGFRQFKRLSEITNPSPARAFVYIDEREDSINDGWFIVDMSGFTPPSPAVWRIVDYPAAYHNRGAGLGFVDGHGETWRWRDLRTMPPLRPGQPLPLNVASPNNRDVARLQAASTSRIN